MKKIMPVFISVILLFAFSACSLQSFDLYDKDGVFINGTSYVRLEDCYWDFNFKDYEMIGADYNSYSRVFLSPDENFLHCICVNAPMDILFVKESLLRQMECVPTYKDISKLEIKSDTLLKKTLFTTDDMTVIEELFSLKSTDNYSELEGITVMYAYNANYGGLYLSIPIYYCENNQSYYADMPREKYKSNIVQLSDELVSRFELEQMR